MLQQFNLASENLRGHTFGKDCVYATLKWLGSMKRVRWGLFEIIYATEVILNLLNLSA